MLDPFPFGIFYSAALMILCTECWYRSDPWLFNHSPLLLFRAPGKTTKANIPATPYTRVFSAWHAGGVCFCLFMSVLALDFPPQAKKEVSLALGLLWTIWAVINSWRAIYGGGEFFRPGAAMHSLIGGCGICAVWHLTFWFANTNSLRMGEIVILSIFAVFSLLALINFSRVRREAIALTR